MTTAPALKERIRAIAPKATALANNNRLTLAQKNVAMHKLELELKGLQDELASVENVSSKAHAIYAAQNRAEAGDDPGGSLGLAAFQGEPMVGAAPSLRVGIGEMKQLQAAALEHRSLAVKAGNITEGTMGPSTYPIQSWPAIGIAREPQRVLDLIPLLPAPETGVVRYYVVSGTTAAAATGEGNVKPLSDVAFTPTDAAIRKIAHRMVASTEVVEDFVGFASYVQMEMQAGLVDAESDEILNGSGTSPHIKGLLNSPGIGTVTANGGEPALTTLQRGITSLRSSGRFCEPDALVMHPHTYSGLITSVDLVERYIAGNPLEAGPPNLWGVPVTLTTKILSGRVLAGNFQIGTRGWVKGGIRLLSNTDSDDFSRNNVTFVCEERLLTAAVAPSALVQIDLVSDFGSS